MVQFFVVREVATGAYLMRHQHRAADGVLFGPFHANRTFAGHAAQAERMRAELASRGIEAVVLPLEPWMAVP